MWLPNHKSAVNVLEYLCTLDIEIFPVCIARIRIANIATSGQSRRDPPWAVTMSCCHVSCVMSSLISDMMVNSK